MNDGLVQQGDGVSRYPVIMYIRGHALVFGGGEVGMRKASSLSGLGVHVRLIDREDIVCEGDIEFIKADIDNDSFLGFIDDETSLVVCALDDAALNERIASYCIDRSIPVNVATSRGSGDIAFPAIIDVGKDIIAVSSLATCPQCAYALKRYIERGLPGISTFSRIAHSLYDEGLLDRGLVARMLDDKEIMANIHEGRYDKVMELLRKDAT
ncbi:MAG TPA: NAD(P)-dependent oxidoreductase [Candidatus Methanofastidiosa archaeon]|nr:NAD(P)-dependent oxidoreductase [Candidatus Methanofastidiosa archaeon]